jgi:hypothetical protein
MEGSWTRGLSMSERASVCCGGDQWAGTSGRSLVMGAGDAAGEQSSEAAELDMRRDE